MLYDLTTLQREANNRYGFSAKRTLAAAQRLYEEHKALTYPRTNSRYLPTDMVEEIKPIAELVGGRAGVPARRRVRGRPGRAAAGAGRRRREGHRPPRDHPDALGAPGREDERRRPPRLRHGGAPLPRGLPPRGRLREHADRDHRRRRGRRGSRVPHPRQAADRAGLARRLRRGRRRHARRGGARGGGRGRRPAAAPARRRRGGPDGVPSRARARKPNRPGATATRRCSVRWRRRASWSTTTSCARR